jgi:hypothetical protein
MYLYLHVAQRTSKCSSVLIHKSLISLCFHLLADAKVWEFGQTKTRLNQNVVWFDISVNLFQLGV